MPIDATKCDGVSAYRRRTWHATGEEKVLPTGGWWGESGGRALKHRAKLREAFFDLPGQILGRIANVVDDTPVSVLVE